MNPQGPPPEFWGILICALAVGLAVGLTIQIFFLLTLYRTQSQVAERNREVQPVTIWWTILLNFIPLVGNLWVIYLVPKLSNSLRREFEDRGWRTEGEGFGRTAGMIWAWGGLAYTALAVVQNVLQFSGNMQAATLLSVVTLPIALGLLVCFILFWVQMYQYGKRLRERERGYGEGTIEADFDDEFRRPRADEEDFDRPRRPRPPEDELRDSGGADRGPR
jgi:uncharacterized protein (DUF2062 family)